MEGWEIKLDPKTGELDLTGLRRREFIEHAPRPLLKAKNFLKEGS
ncbi:MAG: hypothetical protein ACE5OR_12655 [bacterium]